MFHTPPTSPLDPTLPGSLLPQAAIQDFQARLLSEGVGGAVSQDGAHSESSLNKTLAKDWAVIGPEGLLSPNRAGSEVDSGQGLLTPLTPELCLTPDWQEKDSGLEQSLVARAEDATTLSPLELREQQYMASPESSPTHEEPVCSTGRSVTLSHSCSMWEDEWTLVYLQYSPAMVIVLVKMYDSHMTTIRKCYKTRTFISCYLVIGLIK